MNSNRLLSMWLLVSVWLMTPAMSSALDVSPTQRNDISEATQFFTELIQTSKNPLIVSMAQDNLTRLKINEEDDNPVVSSKKVAEIALVPQIDKTYVVPATVNKKYMATFLVDTGASYTVITPQMAETLGIKISKDTPSVPVNTANGILHAPVVRLKHITLGGMRVDNVDAVISDLGDSPQLSGLLGMSFFQGMELSFKQDRLVISR